MNGWRSTTQSVAAVLSVAAGLSHLALAEEPAYGPVRQILRDRCYECHDASTNEGGINLDRFDSFAAMLQERATWKRVFDVVEAGQMPLRDSGYELSAGERETLLNAIDWLQAEPDPELGAVDPGKPLLRRLTRLEYNNTIRDLFGLQHDIFMFPERMPFADKRYFLQSRDGALGATLQTSMREYGQKYDVLLPQHGLPGDNRAEYGYANRGDALNLSPLLFEKYLELAHAIAHSPRLEQESPVMNGLLGRQGLRPPKVAEGSTHPKKESLPAVRPFAGNENVARQAAGNDTALDDFVALLHKAFENGNGGTFDVAASQNNQTVAGRGGLIRVAVGGVALTINPNVDLWLAAFATAQETSGDHLLTNRIKGEKTFELTFKVEGGQEDSGIEQFGICVLARQNQTGRVTLTAMLSNGTNLTRQSEIDSDQGNVFFSFAAPSGTVIRCLRVDGSEFSGDHVLLDDIGFSLRGVAGTRELPPAPSETRSEELQPDSSSGDRIDPSLPLVERFEQFLRLAYRRNVTHDEVSGLVAVFRESLAAGKPEPDAIRAVVQSVLAAPEFLFLSEPFDPDAGSVRRLDDFELANRLSYFLWASMPDAELFELAYQGKLSEPETLRRQVRRMLLDRRHSRELSESFAAQWLKLDQLYSAKPDRKLFPAFYSGPQGKSTLHAAMLTEPLLLFETVLVENRSVLDLCDPDFTWLNAQLAALYGLETAFQATAPSEKSPANVWRRVPLSDRRRGGVMTMAGPLMLTSLPFRTSPVKRGAWLLETVFNRPPAEPKVAFFLEDDEPGDDIESSSLTVRQRFERHRSDPNCASCHSRIDPPGFSLERFDAIGRLRTHDGGQPVDASGVWNAVAFDGPAEFKAALRYREREFVRGFVEHLLSYALGRRIEHFDMPAVTKTVEQAESAGYRMGDLIEGIVLSYPFLQTRNVGRE